MCNRLHADSIFPEKQEGFGYKIITVTLLNKWQTRNTYRPPTMHLAPLYNFNCYTDIMGKEITVGTILPSDWIVWEGDDDAHGFCIYPTEEHVVKFLRREAHAHGCSSAEYLKIKDRKIYKIHYNDIVTHDEYGIFGKAQPPIKIGLVRKFQFVKDCTKEFIP